MEFRKKDYLSFSFSTVTKIVELPYDQLGGIALSDYETVALYGKTNGRRSVRIYNLSRGHELHCIELENGCGGIACVKVGEISALALAY